MKLNPCKKCGSVSYGYVTLVQERNDNLGWYGAMCRLCGRAVQTDPNDSDAIELAMWLFPKKEDAIAAWNAANPVEEKEVEYPKENCPPSEEPAPAPKSDADTINEICTATANKLRELGCEFLISVDYKGQTLQIADMRLLHCLRFMTRL